ncbi:MAG: hypothetical protein HRU75_07645 [Planctomycetia bacterium]|nr:MAG: hypothetical protein HRU75_07645 [Planctomycetia bacterium]
MTPAPALQSLDDYRPCELDPRLFAENLAALRIHAPDLAQRLARVELPPAWRPARALDGWPLFRTERSGEPPQYFGGSAAPSTRAAAVLSIVPESDRNVALPAMLAGAELSLLLRRLPPHAAVFVFEIDPLALAAVLRTQDLRVPLQARRVILTLPEEPDRMLDALLIREEGLLPPATLLRLPGVPEERIAELQALCERLSQRCTKRRSTAVLDPPAAAEPPTDLAVLSLSASATAGRAAVELAEAGRELGLTVLHRALCAPIDAFPLPHVRALIGRRPVLVISCESAPPHLPSTAAPPDYCVPSEAGQFPEPTRDDRAAASRGASRGRPVESPGRSSEHGAQPSPSCAPGARFELRCHPPSQTLASAAPMDADTEVLAASPFVERAWRAAGRHVRPFYWAVRAADLADPPADRRRGASCVLLVGDVPDDSEAAAGVIHPTHRILWRELQRRVRESVFQQRRPEPVGLLDSVERATGMRISDEPTRAALIRAIADRIVPVAIAHRLIDLCVDAAIPCVGLGPGWQRVGVAALRADPPQRVAAFAALAIGAPDPLTPDLLRVAAWGIPVGMPWSGERSIAEFGGVLCPAAHFHPLASTGAANEFLRGARAGRECPIARAAREHLKQHTWSHRLRTLHQPQP